MKTRKTSILVYLAVLVGLTAVSALVWLVRLDSARSRSLRASAPPAAEKVSEDLSLAGGWRREYPRPPHFKPALAGLRIATGARAFDEAWFVERLQPLPNWSGATPARLADLPQKVKDRVGQAGQRTDALLQILGVLAGCMSVQDRGAVLVDFFYVDGQPGETKVEATTLPYEAQARLDACARKAHLAAPMRGETGPLVIPEIIQFPVRNTPVYRRLAEAAL